MSLEPSPKKEPHDALKNEAEWGGLSATKVLLPGQGLPNQTVRHTSHPLSGPKKTVSETTNTVLSAEPPLTEDIVQANEKAAGMIPPSGLQFADGMMLGPFTVTKFIGGGGMGRVYLGIDKSLDRKVAIKVLQRQRAQDQFAVARFMNEAKSAARLNHEHIAQVYFAGQQDDVPFIAFEFVEGTNIRTVVEKQGVFSLQKAITYLIQITHALDHVAIHGVIHRDVKPSNIIITKEGRAKLIDLGLARLLKPTDPEDELTASGVTLGTFDYISPEQARDPRNADIRSDIYSLGCTFFFMLTGRPPFHEGTVLQKLLQHEGDEPPDIRQFLAGAPPEVPYILQKMMAKDPRQRYQTPASLLMELMDLATHLGLRPSAPGKTVWITRSSPKRSMLLTNLPWISGFVLFLVSFVFLSWFWPQKVLPPPVISPREPVVGPSSTNPGEFVTPSPTPREGGPLRYWVENDSQVNNVTVTSHTLPTSRRHRSGLGIRLDGRASAHTKSSASLLAVSPSRGTGSDPNRPTELAVLIVDPSNSQEKEGIYSNLNAAISAAGKDATIELRFNGNANMKIDPMSLTGKNLTIQAGRGYSPALLFRPLDSSVVKEEGRIFLFMVNGGNLRFHGIAFEMGVSPEVYAKEWSLFNMPGPGQLLFIDCSITIRNTSPASVYNEEVSVFRIAQSTNVESNLTGFPPASAAGLSSEDRRTTERIPGTFGSSGISETGEVPVMQASRAVVGEQEGGGGEKSGLLVNQIVLNNCIVRGETTVLSVEAKRSVRMDVDNAFFATDLPFVHLRDVPGLIREKDRKVNISMKHVSLYCKSKLNRFVKKENTFPLSVKWDVKYSVFRLNHTPINEFLGFMTQEEIRSEYSEWDGELAFFQDVSSFAEIRTSSSATYPIRVTLDDWKPRWRSLQIVNTEVFQPSLHANRTVNRMIPTDLTISQRPGNPASGAVPKSESEPQIKIDAGQIYELLPKL